MYPPSSHLYLPTNPFPQSIQPELNNQAMDHFHNAVTSSLSLPVNSYIYSLTPARQHQSLGVISSDDSLYVLDRETLAVLPGGHIPRIHDGVTCLKRFDDQGNVLATAGRDGAVRCWDLRTRKSVVEFRNCASLLCARMCVGLSGLGCVCLVASDVPVLSLCCNYGSGMVAGGTEFVDHEAAVVIWFVLLGAFCWSRGLSRFWVDN